MSPLDVSGATPVSSADELDRWLGDHGASHSERLVVIYLLAHGEAHAHAGSASSPLETLRAHRGVELYLGPAWQALEDAITAEAGILPALSATRAYEQYIAEEGGRAILDLWARLGLTVEVDRRDGRFALWVGEPQR